MGQMRIAVFPNVDKPNAGAVLDRIFRFFSERDVQLMLPMHEARFFGCAETYGVENIEQEPADMALSLGGDGTLLGVCHRYGRNEVPVCGINIGTLGFMADIELDELEDRLEKILDARLVDYVAMDWKNDPDHYALTVGVEESPLAAVTRSLEALLSGTVPFELRTTVVEQLHSKQSFEQIRDYLLPLTGKTGKKIPAFYLQAFKDRDTVPFAGFTAPDKKALEQYGALLEPIADTVRLRGV